MSRFLSAAAVTAAAAALAALSLAGCSFAPNRQADAVFPDPPRQPEAVYLQKAVVARETDPPLPTAVENALALQDKYARALEDLRREQDRSRAIADENRKLSDNAVRLQADLAKTQQELAEANGLLIQMRTEIEKWKSDVLGYRDEMRKASQAQIEALAKVLSLLGAESGAPAAADQAAGQPPAPATAAAPADAKTAAADKARPPAKAAPVGKTAGKGPTK